MMKKIVKKLIRSLFRRPYTHGGVIWGREDKGLRIGTFTPGGMTEFPISPSGGMVLCPEPYCHWYDSYETEEDALDKWGEHINKDHYA